MPTNITPVDTWNTGTIASPAIGDPGDPAQIEAFLQIIADNLERVKGRVPGVSGTVYVQASTPFHTQGGSFSTAIATKAIAEITSCVAQQTRHEIQIPTSSKAVTLTSVQAYFDATNCTVLPTTMPKLTVYKVDSATGTATSLATQSDTSGTTAAFNARHLVQCVVGAATQSGYRYYILVEWGNGGTLTNLELDTLQAVINP